MTSNGTVGRETGAHRKRVEDPKLVQGHGRYVEDIQLPGTLEVAFVRSPHGHARIARVHLEAARGAAGVVAAWSGRDVADAPRIPNRIRFAELNVSPLPPLAHEAVALIGYPVAAVAATDRGLAYDAAGLVEVDYDPLPVVVDAEAALAPSAPLVHPELKTNLAYRIAKEGGDVDGAFARADRTVSLRLVHGRLAQVPMEPRGILASYDSAADVLTVWRSTQSPFLTRSLLSAVLGRPEDAIRVIAPDVGGAFGSKSALYPDELTVVLLAMRLGVPVRWISSRTEDFHLTVQGRDQTNLVDAAFTDQGVVTGLKVRCLFNVGGVLMHPVATPPIRVADYATGAYHIDAYRVEALGVYTNTAPTGPYRGAGRPEAAFIAERMIEEVARALGRDPVEVRRRNFIAPDRFPYRTPVGSTYDSGNYELALGEALRLADYDGFRERQQRSRRAASEAGQPVPLVGIGVATTIEVSGQGQEFGGIDVEADGTVVARTGSSSHGQGHETSFAQVIADRLGVPFERVRILHGDTASTPTGGGTGGSRSLVVGGGALAASAEAVKQKAIAVAAALLEAAADDLVYARGGVEVAGAPDRRVSLAELALAADRGTGLPPGERGLRHEGSFAPAGDAIPFAATVAVVTIERETGRVHLDRVVAVDDCGTVVNPLIVDGQVAGGLTQGLAEALYERVVFGDDGQLLTANLLDYAMPRADAVPVFELGLVETPSPNNPLGAKGIGESGCVSGPPAIVNAVLDALSPLGVNHLDMPLTSEKLWRAVRAAST